MKLIRAVASVAVVIAAIAAIDYFCILPLRCSTIGHRLEQVTAVLAEHEGGVSVAAHARDNLNQVRQCLRVRPTDISLLMVAAANCRLMGDNAAAAAYYERALRYDRRPELYTNLANTQSQIGQRDQAIENLVRAYKFWPGGGAEIEDPFVHDEVLRQIKEYESELRRVN